MGPHHSKDELELINETSKLSLKDPIKFPTASQLCKKPSSTFALYFKNKFSRREVRKNTTNIKSTILNPNSNDNHPTCQDEITTVFENVENANETRPIKKHAVKPLFRTMIPRNSPISTSSRLKSHFVIHTDKQNPMVNSSIYSSCDYPFENFCESMDFSFRPVYKKAENGFMAFIMHADKQNLLPLQKMYSPFIRRKFIMNIATIFENFEGSPYAFEKSFGSLNSNCDLALPITNNYTLNSNHKQFSDMFDYGTLDESYFWEFKSADTPRFNQNTQIPASANKTTRKTASSYKTNTETPMPKRHADIKKSKSYPLDYEKLPNPPNQYKMRKSLYLKFLKNIKDLENNGSADHLDWACFFCQAEQEEDIHFWPRNRKKEIATH